MPNHHALGSSGRTGRVHDVRQVIRSEGQTPRIKVRLGSMCPGSRVGPEIDDGHALPRLTEQTTQRAFGQQSSRFAVLHHEAEPFCRVGGVKRNVSSTRLEHREQPHHQLQAAFQADGHRHIRPHPQVPEVVSEPIGSGVQLRIGQSTFFRDHGYGIGRSKDLAFEELMDAGVGGILCIGRVPPRDDLVTLLVG